MCFFLLVVIGLAINERNTVTNSLLLGVWDSTNNLRNWFLSMHQWWCLFCMSLFVHVPDHDNKYQFYGIFTTFLEALKESDSTLEDLSNLNLTKVLLSQDNIKQFEIWLEYLYLKQDEIMYKWHRNNKDRHTTIHTGKHTPSNNVHITSILNIDQKFFSKWRKT